MHWEFAAPTAANFHGAASCRGEYGTSPRPWTGGRDAPGGPHRRLPLAPPGRSRGCCPPRGFGPPRCLPAPLALTPAPALALPPGARADAAVTAYIPCHARPHSRPPVRRRLVPPRPRPRDRRRVRPHRARGRRAGAGARRAGSGRRRRDAPRPCAGARLRQRALARVPAADPRAHAVATGGGTGGGLLELARG